MRDGKAAAARPSSAGARLHGLHRRRWWRYGSPPTRDGSRPPIGPAAIQPSMRRGERADARDRREMRLGAGDPPMPRLRLHQRAGKEGRGRRTIRPRGGGVRRPASAREQPPGTAGARLRPPRPFHARRSWVGVKKVPTAPAPRSLARSRAILDLTSLEDEGGTGRAGETGTLEEERCSNIRQVDNLELDSRARARSAEGRVRKRKSVCFAISAVGCNSSRKRFDATRAGRVETVRPEREARHPTMARGLPAARAACETSLRTHRQGPLEERGRLRPHAMARPARSGSRRSGSAPPQTIPHAVQEAIANETRSDRSCRESVGQNAPRTTALLVDVGWAWVAYQWSWACAWNPTPPVEETAGAGRSRGRPGPGHDCAR